MPQGSNPFMETYCKVYRIYGYHATCMLRQELLWRYDPGKAGFTDEENGLNANSSPRLKPKKGRVRQGMVSV